MKTTPLIVAGAGTIFSLVQLTPAPLNAIILSFAGGTFAGATAKIIKNVKRAEDILSDLKSRNDDPLAGLPQIAVEDCKAQLKGVTVNFSPVDNNGVRIDNVPSSCMTLANVFLGQNPNQPAPTPMGSASLEYHNLSDDELNQLQAALDKNQGN